jgi:hypothetical protein
MWLWLIDSIKPNNRLVGVLVVLAWYDDIILGAKAVNRRYLNNLDQSVNFF